MLTPVERVEKLMREAPYWSADVRAVAMAIREAENDALERAAKSLEAEDEYTWAAPHVRSLKQPAE